MLIELSIFRFELNLCKDNIKSNRILGSNALNPLFLVIRTMLPYTHSLIVLRLDLSSNTIYGRVFFLFREFIMREILILTLCQNHLETYIGGVHILSSLI